MLGNKVCLSIPSYKRPNGNTLLQLKAFHEARKDIDCRIYVYDFDPYLQEYIDKYGTLVYVIDTMDCPNLAKKRQFILEQAILGGYDYMISIDDDGAKFLVDNKPTDLTTVINTWLEKFLLIKKEHPNIALCGVTDGTARNPEQIKFNYVCGSHAIFDISLVCLSNCRYDPNSKCEDLDFSISMILKGYEECQIKGVAIANQMFGVRGKNSEDRGGLSYRFKDASNRALEEHNYLFEKYGKVYPLAFKQLKSGPMFNAGLYRRYYDV